MDDPEGDEIANWGIIGLDEDTRYKPYMIRDVYRLNFLSSEHLNAPVAGTTLQQWIKADSKHGTLENMTPDFYSWSVDEQHIGHIKEGLKPHNILIAHLDV